MSRCGKIGKLIGALVDGELDPGVARRVEEHLDGCEQCRTVLGRTRRLKALGAPSPPPIDEARWSGIWEGVRRQARGARGASGVEAAAERSPVLRRGFALSALAAAAALLAAVLLLPRSEPIEPPEPMPQVQTVIPGKNKCKVKLAVRNPAYGSMLLLPSKESDVTIIMLFPTEKKGIKIE